jgi:hypothetical protein
MFHFPIEEISFVRRGFRGGNDRTHKRLECIGTAFLAGYHAALENSDPTELTEQLNSIDLELRGFSFEGAAMGLALLDLLFSWRRNRWRSLLNKVDATHQYMMHVGVGWALARFPWLKTHPALTHPLLGWLVIDGYGFHEGYFKWPQYISRQKLPEHFSSYACRVFDQGLGRSLWFVDGADAGRIPTTIATFVQSRQADLWSGVGLACAYAGGVDSDAIEALHEAAGPYRPQLAQGAAFAAKTRQQAGNRTEHTKAACQILCGLSDDAAAEVTDDALERLPGDSDVPAYEIWRNRIQKRFATRNLL